MRAPDKTRYLNALRYIESTEIPFFYTPSQAPFIVMTAIGYQDYYERLITEPAFIHEFQDRVHPHCMREDDVARHIKGLAAGGGYICASSHNITEAIPVANFFAMRDAVHAYRWSKETP